MKDPVMYCWIQRRWWVCGDDSGLCHYYCWEQLGPFLDKCITMPCSAGASALQYIFRIEKKSSQADTWMKAISVKLFYAIRNYGCVVHCSYGGNNGFLFRSENLESPCQYFPTSVKKLSSSLSPTRLQCRSSKVTT